MIERLLKPSEQTGAIKLSAYMWRKQKVEMWKDWRASGVFPRCHLCGFLITDLLDFEPERDTEKSRHLRCQK